MPKSHKRRPVERQDLFRLQFLHGACLAPDGTQAVYGVSHVKQGEKEGTEQETAALWLAALETGESRQLTAGTAVDSAPAWSPDGKRIAFLSTRGGKAQVYTMPVDGGEAWALTSLKQGVAGDPVWSPDGKTIAFTAGQAAEPPDLTKPYRVTRHTYRFDGVGYLDGIVQDIFVVPAEGGEVKQLTQDDCQNSAPRWSPDGRSLLYLSSMKPDSHRIYHPALRVVDLVGESRDVVAEWGFAEAAAWLPDGEHIAFIGAPHGLPIGSKNDLWVAGARGGAPVCRTADLAVGVGGGLQADMPVRGGPSLFVSDDRSSAYVQVQEGGAVGIYRVALSGPESWESVVQGDRACALQDAEAGRLLFAASDLNQPPDLFAAGLDGAAERRLTQLNAGLLADWRLPDVEHLLFPGADGVQVEGWLVKPALGEAPYPTVLYIHGGPHGAFGHVYHFDTQMLAGAGYAVLLVNHRASTGYGDAFSTAIKGDWGNLDYTDLMAGVDAAIARGWADPERLGVCGLSGGGNLSCWIVGQTDRFKAAVPENPVTNWVSFYGVSDIGPWFAVEELGGRPHEIPEVYARCSPITYAHRCTTPTLLLQGEHDYRCPAEQSEQFYAVLKANGCVVEMVRFPASPHEGSIAGDLAIRRAQNEALLDWMNRYVLGV